MAQKPGKLNSAYHCVLNQTIAGAQLCHSGLTTLQSPSTSLEKQVKVQNASAFDRIKAVSSAVTDGKGKPQIPYLVTADHCIFGDCMHIRMSHIALPTTWALATELQRASCTVAF